jgi:uncharacterized membrane protein YcaP (DUF421 family)
VGAFALSLLAVAQFVAAFLASRTGSARTVMTSQPTLLVRDGRMLHDLMQRERVAEAEVRQSVRGAGFGDLERVAAVVLETDGTLSVITPNNLGDSSALTDVRTAVLE